LADGMAQNCPEVDRVTVIQNFMESFNNKPWWMDELFLERAPRKPLRSHWQERCRSNQRIICSNQQKSSGTAVRIKNWGLRRSIHRISVMQPCDVQGKNLVSSASRARDCRPTAF
jgi:hypothetical protein